MHLPAKSPPPPVQMLVLCLLLAASVLPAGCGGSVDGNSQQPDASDLVGADADDLRDDAQLDGTDASDAGEVDTVAPPAGNFFADFRAGHFFLSDGCVMACVNPQIRFRASSEGARPWITKTQGSRHRLYHGLGRFVQAPADYSGKMENRRA